MRSLSRGSRTSSLQPAHHQIRKRKEIHAVTHPVAHLPDREEKAGDELDEAEVASALDEVLGALDDDDDHDGDDRDGGEG